MQFQSSILIHWDILSDEIKAIIHLRNSIPSLLMIKYQNNMKLGHCFVLNFLTFYHKAENLASNDNHTLGKATSSSNSLSNRFALLCLAFSCFLSQGMKHSWSELSI